MSYPQPGKVPGSSLPPPDDIEPVDDELVSVGDGLGGIVLADRRTEGYTRERYLVAWSAPANLALVIEAHHQQQRGTFLQAWPGDSDLRRVQWIGSLRVDWTNPMLAQVRGTMLLATNPE